MTFRCDCIGISEQISSLPTDPTVQASPLRKPLLNFM